MYSIILADGTEIKNLEPDVGKTLLISQEDLDQDLFSRKKLSKITVITPDGYSMEFEDLGLCVFEKRDNVGLVFSFCEIPYELKIAEKFNTNDTDVTDLQLTITELYEMLIKGE